MIAAAGTGHFSNVVQCLEHVARAALRADRAGANARRSLARWSAGEVVVERNGCVQIGQGDWQAI